MDILKFGPDVEVIGPGTLRTTVRERAVALAKLYA
jgi:predicted DNA-binding transcriptional regulator YafY